MQLIIDEQATSIDLTITSTFLSSSSMLHRSNKVWNDLIIFSCSLHASLPSPSLITRTASYKYFSCTSAVQVQHLPIVSRHTNFSFSNAGSITTSSSTLINSVSVFSVSTSESLVNDTLSVLLIRLSSCCWYRWLSFFLRTSIVSSKYTWKNADQYCSNPLSTHWTELNCTRSVRVRSAQTRYKTSILSLFLLASLKIHL